LQGGTAKQSIFAFSLSALAFQLSFLSSQQIICMFPTVSHFLEYLFGVNLPLPFNTFGVFVALAFVAGYWAFTKELQRKEALGILHPITKTVVIGKPATTSELIMNALFGFLIGYKLVYALLNYSLFVSDAQSILMSAKGNVIGGLLLAALFAYWDYKEKDKYKLDKPKETKVTVHPYQLMSNLIVWAAVWGFLGAKFFDNLEYWNKDRSTETEREFHLLHEDLF